MRIESEEKLYQFDQEYKPLLVELFGRSPSWAVNQATLDLRKAWLHIPAEKRKSMIRDLNLVLAFVRGEQD